MFEQAFFDELEKLGARKRKSRIPTLNVPQLNMELTLPAAAPTKEKRPKWGRRIGCLLGRFIHKRILAQQGVSRIRLR